MNLRVVPVFVRGMPVLVALTTTRLAAIFGSCQSIEFIEWFDLATGAAALFAHGENRTDGV